MVFLVIVSIIIFVIICLAKHKENKEIEERKMLIALREKIAREKEAMENKVKFRAEHNIDIDELKLDANSVTARDLPYGVAIDEKGLPYKTDRVYMAGWGKQFNAFITPEGVCYHKRKCQCCYRHDYKCIHVYTAIKEGYRACEVCKPKGKIDDWYIDLVKKQNSKKQYQSDERQVYLPIQTVPPTDIEERRNKE